MRENSEMREGGNLKEERQRTRVQKSGVELAGERALYLNTFQSSTVSKLSSSGGKQHMSLLMTDLVFSLVWVAKM